MKTQRFFRLISVLVLLMTLSGTVSAVTLFGASAQGDVYPAATDDDLVFIHHSCGNNWLSNSLHDALLAKDYIDERNDIYYGTSMAPDAGRPASLGGTPGDNTNMNHWILWFNDYLDGVKSHGSADGFNRIIMFKSCYPISNISSDGTEPGDPFSSAQTTANYKAVYRHPDGPGHTYPRSGYTYKPLEDIFAENPDTLFIPVTAPPRHYAPSDATNDAEAHRAREFNNWLKNDWRAGYNAAHPGLNNVAIFDWFAVLAYPDDHAEHPNRLKEEYGGTSGDSHPNSTANANSTQIFATKPDNFIDSVWNAFISGESTSQKTASTETAVHGQTITYTVVIQDLAAPLTATIYLSDEVPTGLSYVPGTLTATAGTVTDTYAPSLHWFGALTSTPAVTVTYAVTVSATAPQVITNSAVIAAPGYQTITRTATVTVMLPPNYPDLTPSYKAISSRYASYGERVTYTVGIRNNTGPLHETVLLTDVIQNGLVYVPGTLTATSGIITAMMAPTLTWSGVLTPTPLITVTYAATVTYTLSGTATVILPQIITNTAVIAAPGYQTITRTATVRTNWHSIYLPLVLRNGP